ncbi:ankyrin, partial [Gonapodya prolifera JEL478]
DPSGRTPLHIASSRGSIRVASSLIRAIKSSSAISGDSKSLSGAAWKDDDGWTPLHVAVMGRHVDLVKMLLDGFSRGDIETKLSAVGYTPLLLACLQTDNDMVQLLLDYGADPDLVGPQGEGPLHRTYHTTSTNSANILETLLSASRKPNVNLRSTAGCTPLHLASMDGGTECVNLLLVNGADVSMESRDGYNAFEHGESSRMPFCYENICPLHC